MYGRFSRAWAGAARSHSEEPVRGMKKRLPTGGRNGPRLKKARSEGMSIAFIDESGFMLQPFLSRSWAPKGKTLLFPVGSATIESLPYLP